MVLAISPAGRSGVPGLCATTSNRTHPAGIDSLSYTRGSHLFKFGGEIHDTLFSGSKSLTNDNGTFNFGRVTAFTNVPALGNNVSATTLQDFLTGVAASGTILVGNATLSKALSYNRYALFAQDDWRITNRLTLNYGVRYDVELPRQEIDNKMNSFDPLAINPVSGTPGVVTFAGVNGVPERAFRTDLNNIGPRVGFAYRLPGAHEAPVLAAIEAAPDAAVPAG